MKTRKVKTTIKDLEERGQYLGLAGMYQLRSFRHKGKTLLVTELNEVLSIEDYNKLHPEDKYLLPFSMEIKNLGTLVVDPVQFDIEMRREIDKLRASQIAKAYNDLTN